MDNNKKGTILSWPVEGKKILWFADSNKYLIAAPPADEIIQLIWKGKDAESIIDYCTSELGMDKNQGKNLNKEIRQYINDNLQSKSNTTPAKVTQNQIKSGKSGNTKNRYYQIFGIVFFMEYGSAKIEDLIHPKFAHLEIPPDQKFSHHFNVISSGKEFALFVNGALIGNWTAEESHFMTGKFSMEILQIIYDLSEDRWMGVFHAAGITDGKSCIIFLGDSGAGKSTLSTILMASGLDVLADDFLPIENESQLVCRFPASISVKKQGYDMLIPKFPELNKAKEYYNPALDKTFRYLPPNESNPISVPCKALVFIKYDENSGFQIEPMTKEKAFQQLVPDSWISPKRENAGRFVDWFLNIPSYQIRYDDNHQMIQAVKNMLRDEL